ncbi:MAG: minor extracellular serine protease [uncultured Nocardioidaceae bacterium]|uniref:Minor extracellular serine protease n=1 Tax=uncultured Nocardioidaceae bacterium TaxID=253824 RepID=A0A6J4LCM5_9ACTN|nr:MAG: minor extracellular serine protease [uncultured Nocardioidaceae bacterium]
MADGARLLALAQDADKISPSVAQRRTGRHSVFVQLAGQGAADAAALARTRGSSEDVAARARRAAVERTADSVFTAARRADGSATQLFTVSNAVPGTGLRVDAAGLRALAARSEVVRILPLTPKTVTNASAAQLTKVLDTWRSSGLTGEGVTIGVMDTGLDYTHADFGGVGTAAAYEGEDATDPDWRASLPKLARAKIIGGFDFAGDTYDPQSDDPAIATPDPDPNPLDCNGHGTHVAGSAAGYGVRGGGSTFTGDYDRLTADRLNGMRIGPGTAPEAGIYALKVFACDGSTDLVVPALDRALDPNGDGDFSDHLDIVNMSLGSDFGPADEPESVIVNELSDHGVLSVISMGNSGDLTDAGGSPGGAVSSLAVASTVDALQLRDGLEVNAPPTVAGVVAGQVSVAYPWRTAAPVTGDVVTLPGPNADGCDPLSPADAAKVAGKVAWLEWDDNDATRRCGSAARSGNVKAAGAIGALFTSQLDIFGAGISGDAEIPVFQLTRAATERLRPAAEAGTLNVTFDGDLIGTVKDVDPSITDLVSGFTSRGPHGSVGSVKPDVAAPGDTITSAGVGTGSDQLTISGTSMAAPHTAGIAALVKSRHPRWSVLKVKAAVMNGAVHDLWTGRNRTGDRYGPARVGSGRVDALRSTRTKVLAYSAKKDKRVSVSFGPVAASATEDRVVRRQRVVVRNTARAATTATLSYDAVTRQPGVAYRVSPATLTVPGRDTRRVTVTMTVTPSALRRTIDPTMATTQLDVPRNFVSDASGHLQVKPQGRARLRVPVYGAAKPASVTTATAGEGVIDIDGQGVAQGQGSTAYRSLLSVLELGDRSGTLPVCESDAAGTGGCTYSRSSKAGDLEYVGAGSTAEWLWFGISTRAQWANLGTWLIPYVDYDVDGDGAADFETYVQTLPDTDILVAVTVDLAAAPGEELVDLQPVNFQLGDVDTNVFDTDVALLPVSKQVLPEAGADGSLPISYTVGMFDGFGGSVLDESATVAYDAGRPDVQTDGPLFEDRAATDIEYRLRGDAARDGGKALVLHLHGRPGHRAEVVDLP